MRHLLGYSVAELVAIPRTLNAAVQSEEIGRESKALALNYSALSSSGWVRVNTIGILATGLCTGRFIRLQMNCRGCGGLKLEGCSAV